MRAEENLPLVLPSQRGTVPAHWHWVRLADICAGIFDCPHSTPVLTDSGPYVARSQDIRSAVFRAEHAAQVSENTYLERVSRAEPRHGDLLFSREGTYFGIAAEVPSDNRVCLGQRMVLLRPSREVNFRYLRFWLNSPALAAHMEGFHDGSVAQRLNVSTIRALPVAVPPRAQQDAIANVLGALDDKIELNRKMNRALEVLASALFKSWFVDFDPVVAKRDGKTPVGVPRDAVDLFPSHFEDSELGPIPQTWHVSKLGDLAELNARSLSPKDVPPEIRYVEISDVHQGDVDNITVYARGSEPSRARRIVRHGDTVVSAVRPERGAYFLCLEPPPNLIVSTGFVVLTPHADHWALVYCVATSDDALDYYELHAEGGAYPAMRPEAVNNLRLAMPPRDAICDCFSSIVSPLLKYADANRNEARRLAEVRDALLLPLLSGEITLKTAEKAVAEVV